MSKRKICGFFQREGWHGEREGVLRGERSGESFYRGEERSVERANGRGETTLGREQKSLEQRKEDCTVVKKGVTIE